jgi:hypothetical protein
MLRSRESTTTRITPAVVTLTPPAMDPGAAPMNMSTISVNKDASESLPMSTVLNPAVRAVTDWNSDRSAAWPEGMCASRWRRSRA